MGKVEERTERIRKKRGSGDRECMIGSGSIRGLVKSIGEVARESFFGVMSCLAWPDIHSCI